jgi:D-xylose reductase
LTNQTLLVEHHPYLQQKRLIDWVKSKDIHVIAYASFGPAVYNQVPKGIAHLQSLFSHPVIDKISKKHNKGPGEILLRWGVQRDIVVIPKSVNVERMKSNLDLFTFKLDSDEMEAIAAMDENARFNDICAEALNFGVPIFS